MKESLMGHVPSVDNPAHICTKVVPGGTKRKHLIGKMLHDLYCRGAMASGRSRDARARKAARAWKIQDRMRARINNRARKEKYKKPLK